MTLCFVGSDNAYCEGLSYICNKHEVKSVVNVFLFFCSFHKKPVLHVLWIHSTSALVQVAEVSLYTIVTDFELILANLILNKKLQKL